MCEALGLQRFLYEVLGYINPLVSYGPPTPIPLLPALVLCTGVCVCVSVCLFSCAWLLTFSLHSPERGDRGRAKSVPTFSPEISDLPCLLHFFLSLSHFFKKGPSFLRTLLPLHLLPHVTLCALKLISTLFLGDAGSCLSAPLGI